MHLYSNVDKELNSNYDDKYQIYFSTLLNK